MTHSLPATLRHWAKQALPPAVHQWLSAHLFHWEIGIYSGPSPFALEPLGGQDKPVLTRRDVTDVPAAFVADPFMLPVGPTWYLFFEVLNQQTQRGEIGLATSADLQNWTYQRIVLAEPFHLSYPYVFEWQGEVYLIPEAYESQSVRLYKAASFPTDWVLVAPLLSGQNFLDASILRYQERWWLFTETSPNLQNDTLRLFYADNLEGPWQEHLQSPILQGNPHQARPAGRIQTVGDRLIRYAQDCYPTYGTQVYALEITELTPLKYAETLVQPQPILQPSGRGWNKSGMHHLDPHSLPNGQWVACVDGCWSYR